MREAVHSPEDNQPAGIRARVNKWEGERMEAVPGKFDTTLLGTQVGFDNLEVLKPAVGKPRSALRQLADIPEHQRAV